MEERWVFMQKNNARFYIIGAGFAGQMIAQDIKRKKVFGSVAAFLDDNKDRIGTQIDGTIDCRHHKSRLRATNVSRLTTPQKYCGAPGTTRQSLPCPPPPLKESVNYMKS